MSSGQDTVTVAIESGLHAGVALGLPPGRTAIGRDISADIVLHDDGVAPFHLVIETTADGIQLEALADGVEIEDVATLSRGESCLLPLPAVTRIGDARLRWSWPEIAMVPPQNGSFLRRMVPSRTAWIAGVAAVLCGGFLTTNPVADAAFRSVGVRSSSTGGETPSTAAEASPKLAALPDRVTVAPRFPMSEKTPVSAEAAVSLIRAEIAKAGLLNVSVSSGDGVIMASGSIEPGSVPLWQAVQQLFDERFAGELTLVNAVAVRAEKLPSSIAIEAVWRGPAPYLIVRGQKYALGSTLDGGWAIERIEPERVLLKREGRVVAVRY